ncbi:hypothetical protein QVD17_07898 [Tagetes erecta]|uniref:Uncharacterized protein n=1 Tax=Tagetes erecta TaxID=13708 RepID=A0AAD8KZH7_TARER|nr:hypothetical protein QVD17_07898 [Tagetes erecta]
MNTKNFILDFIDDSFKSSHPVGQGCLGLQEILLLCNDGSKSVVLSNSVFTLPVQSGFSRGNLVLDTICTYGGWILNLPTMSGFLLDILKGAKPADTEHTNQTLERRNRSTYGSDTR